MNDSVQQHIIQINHLMTLFAVLANLLKDDDNATQFT